MADDDDELLDKLGKRVAIRTVERALGGVPISAGIALLRDHKGWDPVVPPDLHEVVPAKVDADGNVTCRYCAKPTPFADADLLGSEGFVCRGCAMSRSASIASTPPRRPSRAPWIIGGAVVLGAAVVAMIVVAHVAGSSTDDDEPAGLQPLPVLDEAMVQRWEASAANLDPAAALGAADSPPESVRAEPPWIVIESPGHASVRIDSRVFDRIEGKADDDNGPHLLLAVGDQEVALDVEAGLDEARRLAAALARGKRARLPPGPRLTVGGEALEREGDHVRIGERRFLYDGICRRVRTGDDLDVHGDSVHAALVWLVLRAESARPLCDWE